MGLITEAETTPQGFEINLSNVFESGKYRVTPDVVNKINVPIAKIKNFITKNPNKPIIVTIESSESKVPNYDREKFPSTGDKNKDFSEDKKLPVGALSKNRATNLSTYLKTQLPKNVTITIVDKGAQGPQWKAPFNAQDPNYTKFQYVKLYTKVNVIQPPTGSTETEVLSGPCNQTFNSKGVYGDSARGFIAEEFNINFGKGENLFYVKLLPYTVPDILIVEYNGKTYTTGLVGADFEVNRIMVATIIANYYKDAPKPWYFNNLSYVEVSPQYADGMLLQNSREWDSNSLYTLNPSLKLENGFFGRNRGVIRPYMLKPGQIKKFEPNGTSAWDSVETLKIQQVKGVDTAKVTVIGIVGTTEWRLDVECNPDKTPVQKPSDDYYKNYKINPNTKITA